MRRICYFALSLTAMYLISCYCICINLLINSILCCVILNLYLVYCFASRVLHSPPPPLKNLCPPLAKPRGALPPPPPWGRNTWKSVSVRPLE